jgi:class 3 adenylate cyclase
MARESRHLLDFIEKYNHLADMQIVFADIEKYSQRTTAMQISVIHAFTECKREALAATERRYADYFRNDRLEFLQDIIKLPTGDGAATVFSFKGLTDIHLQFALSLLQTASRLRQKEQCADFQREGWCDCHPYFNLRIGLSEGRGVVYLDMREDFNVAGRVVNMAARVMGLADRNQIMFTDEAHKQIVDVTADPDFADRFVEFAGVEIKHGVKINAFQYTDKSLPFLDSGLPSALEHLLYARMKERLAAVRRM